MIRVVVDPGVFISALVGGRGGAPDLVMRAFVDERMRREFIHRVSGDRDLTDAGLSQPAVWTPRRLADQLPER